MKKLFSLFTASCLSLAMLASCSTTMKPTESMASTEVKTENTQQTDQPKLKIVTSFYPMYDFTKKLVGNKAEVVNLVQPGVEPHDWEPTPADIKIISEAKVLVFHGAGMEHWVEDVLEALPNKELKTIEASAGLTLLKAEEYDHDHEHKDDADHDHEHKDDADHDHEHKDDADHDHEHEHHHHGEFDPHVWLAPEMARLEMQNIAKSLTEAAPELKEEIAGNLAKYESEFAKLHDEYTKGLANLSSKSLVTAHEAFAYLASAYGLEQMGIEGISADEEPSPARMAELVEFVKHEKVTTIFFEELVSPKVAEALAREVNAKTSVLNTLESLSQADMDQGEDYFSIMRKNLVALQEALK